MNGNLIDAFILYACVKELSDNKSISLLYVFLPLWMNGWNEIRKNGLRFEVHINEYAQTYLVMMPHFIICILMKLQT